MRLSSGGIVKRSDISIEKSTKSAKSDESVNRIQMKKLHNESVSGLVSAFEGANSSDVRVAVNATPSTRNETEWNSSNQLKDDETFAQKYGYILAIAAGISISGTSLSILIVVINCYRKTRRATAGALALPISLLPEDRTPLHAKPEHPVPMLSVQSAGCAGMERLGVPARTSLNNPPDDRGHISRRMRVDSIQARDLLVHDTALLSDRQLRNNNHLNHYHRVGCGSNSSSYSICNSSNICVELDAATIMTAQQQQQAVTAKLKPINNDIHHHQQQPQQIRCPHHVPLPDSEWGQDRNLQIRTRYQQSEITRSYIKPPPNKTVLDVPEQSYNFFSSTALSSTASASTSGISCNLRPNLTNQNSNIHNNYHLQQQPCTSGSQLQQHHHHHHPHHHHQQQQQQQAAILSQQQKSKPNVITKLFSRKSSPKSPTALCSSSSISSNSSLSSSASSSSSSSSSSPSSSSVSTSSSSSSLCSAQTLPISTAATLTATTCSLGAAAPIQNNPMPTSSNNFTSSSSSSSFLTTIGATSAIRGSPSPPLTVTVPVGATSSASANGMLQQHLQQFHLQQQQQQQQQSLLFVDSTNSSNLSSTSSLHLIKSSSCSLSPNCITSSSVTPPPPAPQSTLSLTAEAPSTSIDCCYAQATSAQRSYVSSSSNTAPNSPSTSSLLSSATQQQQQQQSIDNCGNSDSSNSSSTSSISSNNSVSHSRNYQNHI